MGSVVSSPSFPYFLKNHEPKLNKGSEQGLSMPIIFLNLGQKVVIELVQTAIRIMDICKGLDCKDLHSLKNLSIPK